MIPSRFSLIPRLALVPDGAACPQAEAEHVVHTAGPVTGDDGLTQVTWSDATGMPRRAGTACRFELTNAAGPG